MVTARNRSGTVTRKSSFFKKGRSKFQRRVMTRIVTFLCVDLREQITKHPSYPVPRDEKEDVLIDMEHSSNGEAMNG